jgi:adenine-specific DNA-methyltransferase
MPNGREIVAKWSCSQETFDRYVKENMVVIPKEGEGMLRVKIFLSELEGQIPNTWWDDVATNDEASKEIEELFGSNAAFSFPKPTGLIKRILHLSTNKDSIILDSFAGSGTTMHAVMELNKEDGGNRKCIMIQMTEATEAEPDKNICKDITRERVKRAIDKYGYDSGFKYYRLGIPIDAETMLAGQLATYKQFAKYVYYLCTDEHLEAEDKINEEEYYVGEYGKQAIYLVYKQDYETLTRLALNLTLAEKIKQQQPGKKRIVYAPSCFLDEEYLTDNQIEFVGIPYNLFSRNSR